MAWSCVDDGGSLYNIWSCVDDGGSLYNGMVMC